MARLEAIASATTAAPGNNNAVRVNISVTNERGDPGSGLVQGDFSIDTFVVGAGGSGANGITWFREDGQMPGFYHIDVANTAGQTWNTGTYVFGFAVSSGNHNGQTLVSVDIG